MKQYPKITDQPGTYGEISLSVVGLAPNRAFDDSQTLYTLAFIEQARGYKLNDYDREQICLLVSNHLERIYQD